MLAGDIGGTRTRLGLFRPTGNRPELETFESYLSSEASGLPELVERFLESHPATVQAACFGVAGPVIEGRCKVTNLRWEVSREDIRKCFSWPEVRLINDLEATALSVPILEEDELVPIHPGKPAAGAAIGLVAPGTGFGQALLVFGKENPVTVASEGGHVDFAPNSEEEVALWRYLRAGFGHVSVERILSGPGLINIYTWMKQAGLHRESEAVARQMAKGEPAKVITAFAMERGDSLCRAAVTRFVSILGSVAGNVALTGMARGGMYIAGGIASAILTALREGPFVEAFLDKGRFRSFLEKIPVSVILNEKAGLMGAARCASPYLKSPQKKAGTTCETDRNRRQGRPQGQSQGR